MKTAVAASVPMMSVNPVLIVYPISRNVRFPTSVAAESVLSIQMRHLFVVLEEIVLRRGTNVRQMLIVARVIAITKESVDQKRPIVFPLVVPVRSRKTVVHNTVTWIVVLVREVRLFEIL
jgi:hypothetical protein